MVKVYNFKDFETAVLTANSGNVTVLPMKSLDFKNWLDHSSRSKKQSGHHYMHDIIQVTATRGSLDLKYKKSFSSTEEFTLNFLQEKFRKCGIPCPEQVTNDCGISKERKENILKLNGILKADKIQFYRDLAVAQPIKSKAVAESKQRKSIPRQGRKVNETSKKPNTKKNEQKTSQPIKTKRKI